MELETSVKVSVRREEMAGIEKIVIPQLGGDNWSVWKAKFWALLEYKGLNVAIEQPDSVEGKKASGQAKALMILHTQDAYVKLIVGERTAAKAWKKLEENFEKKSNARVIQLRKKLASMKLTGGQSIAEYLSEIREVKVDLEAAGQSVTDTELVVFALNGLPSEYATLVEFLEMGESALTLDDIQPKLMQREQKLKLLDGVDESEERDMTAAFVAQKENVTERNASRRTDTRTCYACGEKGHIKADCRKRNAECYNCGERGHISSVCRKPRGGAKSEGEKRTAFAGVAYTAWRKEAHVRADVWLVDSGSTQHITSERSQFVSYKKLARAEKIEGLGGEALEAVGIGRVVLECETPSGRSVVTLNEVRHVPGAKVNLFAMGRATDAGARVSFENGKAQFEMHGVVNMEAVKRDGLWEIVTAKKEKAIVAVRRPTNVRHEARAVMRKPQVFVEKRKEKKETVKVVEVDLELDEEQETEFEKRDATESVGAPKAKSVGARIERVVEEKSAETVGAENETEQATSTESEGRRYPERAREPPGNFWESGSGWVTPKSKKRNGKSG